MSEPQHPLLPPVFSQTSCTHLSGTQREKETEVPFCPLLHQSLPIPWKAITFPRSWNRLVLPIFVPHWLFQQGHPEPLSQLGISEAFFVFQVAAYVCRIVGGLSISLLQDLACSYSTQCSGDPSPPMASLPSLCSPAAQVSLLSSRHIRCLSNRYLYLLFPPCTSKSTVRPVQNGSHHQHSQVLPQCSFCCSPY